VKRAVFLDRDGVINRAFVRNGKPYPPDSMTELEILPGVEEALRAFRAAGLLNIVVTNQPDVATGKQQREIVETFHAVLGEKLAIDEFRACYHTHDDFCHCRKPEPGMLLDAARKHDIDLSHSFLVGDRWRDVGAGKVAGCTTFFIDYGYGERRPETPDHVVGSLSEACSIILSLIAQSRS
jgi:D-glycero-D-manno-heptose 1,7-bisphosphate phosphatase